jgi:hypothetical protein
MEAGNKAVFGVFPFRLSIIHYILFRDHNNRLAATKPTYFCVSMVKLSAIATHEHITTPLLNLRE